MYLRCLCGNILTDVGSPNEMEHLLLSNRAMERLQDLVDEEVAEHGEEQLWPEHWREAGAQHVWKCNECGRLLLNARGESKDVVVYRVERQGIE